MKVRLLDGISTWIAILTALGLALVTTTLLRAQTVVPLPYPHRIVTIVTHSSPGGGSDVFVRELVRHLRDHIDATFVVENVAGGSGARAVARVAMAEPDGSVLYVTTPTYVLTSLLSQPRYRYSDLEPLVNFFTDSEIVYTRADGPFATLAAVIDRAAKSRGRWGAANPASLERQAAEQLKRAAGVNAAVVSHEGGGDLMLNVLNGTLDIGVGEIGELLAQLEANRIRLLATFNAERLPTYPNVPTVRELGYDVVMRKFRGLAGPKGLSPEIIRIWNEAARRLLADPEYRDGYESKSLVPNYIAHDEYGAFVTAFATETETLLRESGIIR